VPAGAQGRELALRPLAFAIWQFLLEFELRQFWRQNGGIAEHELRPVITFIRIVASIYFLAVATGCAMQVVAALRTGQIDTRHGVFRRKSRPIGFWVWTANSLFWACFFALGLAYGWRDLL